MNRVVILELFNKHLRIDFSFPDCRREANDTVIRLVSLTNEPGLVGYSTLTELNADAVIDEQLAYFQGLKQSFEWKVFDYDQPSDLKERLQAKGFSIEEPEALMISDLTETNQLLDISVHPEVRRITDEQGIWDIIKLEEEVWGESHQDLGDRFVRELNDPSAHLSLYAAYVDGKAVSAA